MVIGIQKGFTLIELLIVMTVIAIITLIAAGISVGFFSRNQLADQSEQLISVLRVAQSRTVAGYADGSWGVHLTSSTYTLFQGANYAGRSTAYDEVHTLPEGITASGLSDVIFTIRTGETSNTGTITLTDVASGITKTITINANGRVTAL